MSKNTIPWKRFWVPQGQSITLDDSGYLLDPEQEDSEFIRFYNPGIATLEQLSDKLCLILLGSAGAGKSTTLSEYKNKLLQESTQPENPAVIWIDFKIVAADVQFIRELLLKRQKFTQWYYGERNLTIILDGLDEGILRIDKIGKTILGELRDTMKEKRGTKQLQLIISCRSAAWSNDLQNHFLNDLFPGQVSVYQLAPLRQNDIRLAAKNDKVNADQFFQEVAKRGFIPAVRTPISLFFLLEKYSKTSELPTNFEELWEELILNLYRKANNDRLKHHI